MSQQKQIKQKVKLLDLFPRSVIFWILMSELSVVYAFYSPLYDDLSGANLIIILYAIFINIAVLYICYTRYQMYKELQNY